SSRPRKSPPDARPAPPRSFRSLEQKKSAASLRKPPIDLALADGASVATRPAPSEASVRGRAQGRADAVEHRLQAVAGELQRRDDDNRDQSGDQTIFDRGRAQIRFEKLTNTPNRFHRSLSS